jgi:hypothetical protein
VDDDADRLPAFVVETLGVLAATTADHELILVDDGSGRRTVAACDRLLAEHECIRVIRLSRRFGADIAAASWDSVIFDLGGDSLVRIPTLEPLRGSKAHVGALLDSVDSAAELVEQLTT